VPRAICRFATPVVQCKGSCPSSGQGSVEFVRAPLEEDEEVESTAVRVLGIAEAPQDLVDEFLQGPSTASMQALFAPTEADRKRQRRMLLWFSHKFLGHNSSGAGTASLVPEPMAGRES
jgi:hypothetical protein